MTTEPLTEIVWGEPEGSQDSIADMIHKEVMDHPAREAGHVLVANAGRASALRKRLIALGLESWTKKGTEVWFRIKQTNATPAGTASGDVLPEPTPTPPKGTTKVPFNPK